MADIILKNETSGGKVRARRLSAKIDMTPMVDLAFLLLTFFILTSSFNNFKIMQVDMPDKPSAPMPLPTVQDKDVLNLILAEDNKILWWIGMDPPARITNYSVRGIRRILLDHVANPKLVVLIKPMDNSKYENIVDILDEIDITAIKRYAIVDFTEEDKILISAETR